MQTSGQFCSRLDDVLRTHWRFSWSALSLGSAVWAAMVARDQDHPAHHLWGLFAAAAYLLCALLAWTTPRRLVAPVLGGVATVGAVFVPLVVLSASADYQSEVGVVQRSAGLLMNTGFGYVRHPHVWLDYDPYLPAMSVYGVPHQLLDQHRDVGLQGRLMLIAGDARIWFAAVFTVCLLVSWYLLRNREPTTSYLRSLQAPSLIVASPIVALPLCVSGIDLPTAGFTCLAIAAAARGGNGVVVGLLTAAACLLKWTAWPLLPVMVAFVAMRRGARHAIGCAAVGTIWAAASIVPASLRDPDELLEQVVRYPLGLSRGQTPAASPLLGHELAELGLAGRIAALALLALGCIAVGWWTARYAPRDAREAANRLAVGLSIMFLLSPASRFGYFMLPAVVWLIPHTAADGLGLNETRARGRAQLAAWAGRVRRQPEPHEVRPW